MTVRVQVASDPGGAETIEFADAASIVGVITRPFIWPEAISAAAGAIILVIAGLLPAIDAGHGVLKGLDVYLLIGIVVTGIVLIASSALDLPTFIAGLATVIVMLAINREGPWDTVTNISWR